MYVCCMEKSEENMFVQIAINNEKFSIITEPHGVDTFFPHFNDRNHFYVFLFASLDKCIPGGANSYL